MAITMAITGRQEVREALGVYRNYGSRTLGIGVAMCCVLATGPHSQAAVSLRTTPERVASAPPRPRRNSEPADTKSWTTITPPKPCASRLRRGCTGGVL